MLSFLYNKWVSYKMIVVLIFGLLEKILTGIENISKLNTFRDSIDSLKLKITLRMKISR